MHTCTKLSARGTRSARFRSAENAKSLAPECSQVSLWTPNPERSWEEQNFRTLPTSACMGSCICGRPPAGSSSACIRKAHLPPPTPHWWRLRSKVEVHQARGHVSILGTHPRQFLFLLHASSRPVWRNGFGRVSVFLSAVYRGEDREQPTPRPAEVPEGDISKWPQSVCPVNQQRPCQQRARRDEAQASRGGGIA